MPHYVLLRHELPPESGGLSHWDFMLEHQGVLWTWAIKELPNAWCEQLRLPPGNSSNEVFARQLSDHRLAYLDYEGPVSEGRGRVTRLATGEYSIVKQLPDSLEARLGGTLQGIATLTRRNDTTDSWKLQIASETRT